MALPTRNRGELAVQALDCVLPQLRPGDELIVADDGSAQAELERVEKRLSEDAGPGRLLRLPPGGISAARNALLSEARAQVVCFLDDDERPGPEWLSTLRLSWVRADARVGAIGGPMRLVWLAPRPAWLEDYLLYVVNGPDLGTERLRLDPSFDRGFLTGGNLSVRVSAALEVGGFDDRLGLRPEAPYDRGEEDDFQRRLAAAGWETWFEPTATVDHLAPITRLRKGYFIASHRARGRRDARQGKPRGRAAALLARAAARYAALRLSGSPRAPTAVFQLAYAWSFLTTRRGAKP